MSSGLSEESASHCEQIAREVRGELGLGAKQRLDPRELAALLAIEIVAIGDYAADCGDEVCRLTDADPTALSAVTVFCGSQCMIVVNPAHPDHSEDESVRHELAHVLLEHPPRPLFDENGERIWHTCHEAQADYLGFALAVSKPELERMMTVLEGDLHALATHYGADLAIISQRMGRVAPSETPRVPAVAEPMVGDVTATDPIISRLRGSPPPPDQDGGTPAPAPSPTA